MLRGRNPSIVALGRLHQQVHPLSRQEFLTSLAAIAAGALLPGSAPRALAYGNGGKPELIDVHHHILPTGYLAVARDRIIAQGQKYLPATVLEWTPENSLAEMDRVGVATAIVSISTPGVWFGGVEADRRLARECNEYAAGLVRQYPGRFGFFAAVSLPDIDGSLGEITYALDVLKADGIGLMTSYGDQWPGDPKFAPVFEELNRRSTVVYIHPTGPNCCRELIPYVPYVMTELPHDTTRAITSLLFAGAFAKFRNVRFVFSHAGGTLPMVAGRIARQGKAIPEFADKVPNGVDYELKRLYYEIAGSANRPAIAALTNLVPTSQILFGSDYPWGRIGMTADAMTDVGFSAAEVQAVGHDNALALFARLKR